jgi:hypothetical protein
METHGRRAAHPDIDALHNRPDGFAVRADERAA